MRCWEKHEKHETFDNGDIVTYDDKEMLSFVPYGNDS